MRFLAGSAGKGLAVFSFARAIRQKSEGFLASSVAARDAVARRSIFVIGVLTVAAGRKGGVTILGDRRVRK